MFCHKCGSKLPEDSVFCPKCGTKVASEEMTEPAPVDVVSTATPKSDTPVSTTAPVKTGGLRSVVRLGRNVLGFLGITIALFSFFGIIGLIIAAVIIVILIIAGWSMSVAEKQKEEENEK